MRVFSSRNLTWDGDHLRLGPRGRKLVEVVADERYPQMWRVRRQDGSLADMLNRTRAKDAAIGYALHILNRQESTAPSPPIRLNADPLVE